MKILCFLLAATTFAAKPTAVSGLPAAAVGPSTVLTFTGRDKDGATDIGWMYFLVNTNATIPANTCHGLYDRAANAFYLYTDDLSWAEGPLAPGAAASIENSQCAVEGSSSGALATGNDLVVKLAITVKSPFGDSNKSVYLWVKDKKGDETGWVKTGTWLNAAPSPPTNPPTTPTPALRMIDQPFVLPGSLNQWVTLAYTPAADTLIMSWFSSDAVNATGQPITQAWGTIRPRLGFDNPKDVEIVTDKPGTVLLVYWTAEPAK